MKVDTYTATGTKVTATDLPKEMGKDVNMHLLAQAVRVYENRLHTGVSRSKTRGEVTASTRKIYRQKGTGRARHGALSAPIFVGGGKAHGPTGNKRSLSMPKKMRRRALQSALNLKAKNKELIFVSGISKIKKTKEAANLLTKIYQNQSRYTVALASQNQEQEVFFRNIKNVNIIPFSALNAYQVFRGGALIVDKDVLKNEKKSKTTKTQKSQKKTKKS